MAAPTGMCFRFDQWGAPQPLPGLNTGTAPYADSPPTGDFTITVTNVPLGTTIATVQAALVNYCSLPIPFTSPNWNIGRQ